MNNAEIKQNHVRDSSFEILRIIAILFVVSEHLYYLIRIDSIGTAEYFAYNGVRCIDDCAVDLFVLITGFWGIRFRFSKLLSLFFQSLFYAALMFFIQVFMKGHDLFGRKDFLVFLPIINGNPWFIATYSALCCLAPFYNRFIALCAENQLRILLWVGFVLFYLWPTFSFLVNSRQLVNDAGFGIVNFSYLYFLGRYLSLHHKTKKSKSFYVCGFFVIGLLLLLTHFGVSKLLGFEFNPYFSYNTVFVLAQAVMLILLFKKIARIGFRSAIINKIASYSLAVYLFHSCLTPYFRPEVTVPSLLFTAALIPFLLYALTIPVEFLRRTLFGHFEDWLICRIEKIKYIEKISSSLTQI